MGKGICNSTNFFFKKHILIVKKTKRTGKKMALSGASQKNKYPIDIWQVVSSLLNNEKNTN